jgi:xylulose-5-phosphate/fructose-6-phosphate phosphoketolase
MHGKGQRQASFMTLRSACHKKSALASASAPLRRLFRQFSWPYGIPSHVSPETPGSIHEGGELGYSLAHAYGAAFDNPDLIVACIVGDGEAETGPLATSWHSNKFLNPARDGAVLPILHLNGFKIANPTVLARIDQQELTELFYGYGYDPWIVEGDDPPQRASAACRCAGQGSGADPGDPTNRARPRQVR